MNQKFIDSVLETLRDDEKQICKQAAHIIAELAAEIDGLQSLNDFQQQQISCMQSEIEAKDDEIETKEYELDGWKRLNDYYINQVNARKSDIEKMKCCQNCQSYNAQGEYSKCHLHISTALDCLENNFSVWRLR